MYLHPYRLAQIKAEYAHDGFGVDHIAARRQVDIKIIPVGDVNEIFNIVDGFQHDIHYFHFIYPPFGKCGDNA